MISTNIIYIDNFDFKITNKNNSIQISIFNNDKVSKQKNYKIYNYKKNLENNKKKLGNYFLGFIEKTLLYKDL